ncbi:MAG: Gfo/Idh/MocA family oxidoreductase [Alphaproteobacteria bacterium]
MAKPPLRVGLIGSGFMGACHANAWRAVSGIFDVPLEPVLELLADVDDAAAAKNAARFGFRRSTGDWRALVADPEIDVVDVTAPNILHHEIGMAAIAAGKIAYCEKPLANTVADCAALAAAAAAAGVPTAIGYNYLKNPMIGLARDIIQSGEIGEVVGFRGIHAEDYMTDPAAPFSFRNELVGGGVLADLGSHIIAMARFLVAPITEVCGHLHTVVHERPVARGASQMRPVTTDDQVSFLCSFANGAAGVIEASWVAQGRKMQLGFELTGTRGSLAFDAERLNELQLSTMGQPKGREGFKTIWAGPDHPPYGAFCPAPGHQLGFNELKIIEVRDILLALGSPERRPWPDFAEGLAVQQVIEAVRVSAERRSWARVEGV